MTYEQALRWLRVEAAEITSLYPQPRPDYRGRAVTADTVRNYLETEKRRFAEVVSLLPKIPHEGARLLEVGIAYGFIAALAKASGWEAEGIEVPENVPVYCAFARHHGIPIHPGKLGVEQLHLPDASYEAVVFSEVLEHLRLSPGIVFRELHRILSPGGCLLVTTPNAARIVNVAKLLLGRNVAEAFPEDAACENATELLTHVREYTMREVRASLRDAGFKVRMARYSAGMEWGRPRHLLTALVPPWRGSLVLLAQKRA